MSAKIVKQFNNFIEDFFKTELCSECLDNIKVNWNDGEIQKQLQTFIKQSIKKGVSKEKRKVNKKSPKKSKTAYIYFCMDEREKIKTQMENGEIRNIESKKIINELAGRWKEFKKNHDISKYEKLAEQDKERYNNEKEIYESESHSTCEEVEITKPKPSKKKDAKKVQEVKKPTTAYVFFCREQKPVLLENNPELTKNEILKELSTMWKQLKEEKNTSKYDKMANKDKERYNKQVNNESTTKKKTAYNYYCVDERKNIKEKNPELKASDITKELSIRWKSCKDNNPDIYQHYVEMAESSDKVHLKKIIDESDREVVVDSDNDE
jgi:hypothetical protein